MAYSSVVEVETRTRSMIGIVNEIFAHPEDLILKQWSDTALIQLLFSYNSDLIRLEGMNFSLQSS